MGAAALGAAVVRAGIGAAVLEALVAEAVRHGMEQVMLNAQVQALDFYRRQGFIEEGEPFMEAGIVHRAMRRCCRASGEGGA